MATKYVDAASAGGGDGTTWDLSGANAAYTEAECETFLEGAVAAGDDIWVMDGTYTLDSAIDWNLRDGTAIAPIYIIGVKSGTTATPPTYADWAVADADRPVFACGVNDFRTSDFVHILNCQFTTSDTYGIYLGTSCLLQNCKITQGSGSAYEAIRAGIGSRIVNCEITSNAGEGIYGAFDTRVLFCYIHDCSTYGYNTVYDSSVLLFNVFDTCTTAGINIGAKQYSTYVNNTIYNCGSGILGSTGYSALGINNIINDNTTGLNWTTETDDNVWMYNNLEGNGTARTNVDHTNVYIKDNWATAVDPEFDNAAGGDFSLEDNQGSCIDAGMSITVGVG